MATAPLPPERLGLSWPRPVSKSPPRTNLGVASDRHRSFQYGVSHFCNKMKTLQFHWILTIDMTMCFKKNGKNLSIPIDFHYGRRVFPENEKKGTRFISIFKPAIVF